MHFPPSYSYGKVTHNSDHVDTVMKANQLQGMKGKFNDIKEAQYASNMREPLGKGFSRDY